MSSHYKRNVKDSCRDVNIRHTQQINKFISETNKTMDANIRHRIPVFVFPTVLNFYLNAKHTHKQLLTLYNPYDFPVRFSVFSTAPNKYTVIDPDGSIGPQACVDIVVRHTLPIAANCNVVDKFRISMQDHSTRELIGKRDIESRLLQGEPDNNSNDGGDNFQTLAGSDRPRDAQSGSQSSKQSTRGNRLSPAYTPNYVVLLATLVSIVGLWLPTQQETQPPSSIPAYLHMSHQTKLVFAFVLGIVCVVILRI